MIMLGLLTLSMTGCSSSSKFSSDGTSIYINGEKALLSTYDGTTGQYESEDGNYLVDYSKCVEAIRDCPQNKQSIHEDDVSKYKKSTYFMMFMDSYCVMNYPLSNEKDYVSEAVINSIDAKSNPIDTIRDSVYDTMINLTYEPIYEATFANAIKVKSEDVSIILRNTGITIPNVLTVGKGEKDCTQQVDINGVTVLKLESNNYDYYQYGDNLIKCKKGLEVGDYIELLSLE